ncbi:DUF1292 domain-containing protein [Roseburia sp. MUC/MUC-530-WT-4D]|uniref:DUF1292 domain-containing protein n=1 Tax=Roseburia porci TaxID=2605790 RepID=A0A6L5YQI6_9FIRM|nr:DUF1292 domain-containing protein [Roseburia porci]MCI5516048.1 DUF1292 domain-containing protein [Roseburia sp.]MDD6743868.1 DUF1292 domain-containing protein [Roseburia porci]MST74575.1 DUF1292 domain-containing protein [Roseburia porci]
MSKHEKATPVTEEEKDDIRVTLELDDGEVECKIFTIFDMGDQDYIALIPLDADGNENSNGDLYVYRYYEDEEGLPSVENITDDDEYEAVVDRFDEVQDEIMFNEMDDE